MIKSITPFPIGAFAGFHHPGTIENIQWFVPEFYATKHHSQTLPFIQYVKIHNESTYKPIISFTKPSTLSNGRVLWLSGLSSGLGNVSKQIEQVIKIDQFKLKHFKQFQQLTNREVEILKMLTNGFNNPQIAGEF